VKKTIDQIMRSGSVLDIKGYDPKNPYAIVDDAPTLNIAAEEQETYKTIPQMEKAIAKVKKEMEKAARDLDFIQAANLRDQMFTLEKELQSMK
jgi:excinuclease ABC subunit B